MELKQIYEYRFKGIEQKRRIECWQCIAQWIMIQMEYPQKMLEVGAGRCEFINHCGAKERWALDSEPGTKRYASDEVAVVIGKLQEADLRHEYFDAIFMSNFLEHLNSPEEANEILGICFSLLKWGGRIGILGPNFKYAYREYFDCADHVLPFTHIGVGEHLAGLGFNNIKMIPKFLPFSFRSALPSYPVFVKLFLKLPLAWGILGKQFFITARKG